MGNTRRTIKRVGSRVVQISYELEETVEKQRNGREPGSNSGTKSEHHQEETTKVIASANTYLHILFCSSASQYTNMV